MFDQLSGLVKDQVAKTVGSIEGVPADKTSAVVDTTASSLMSGLQQFATPDKLSALLGGGGSGASGGGLGSLLGDSKGASAGGGAGASGLSGGVVQALTSKVGLSPTVAKSIAAAAILAVLALLKKQSSTGGGGLQSLVGALAGGSGTGGGGGIGAMLGGLAGGSGLGSGGGGLLGKLGGLFGKG